MSKDINKVETNLKAPKKLKILVTIIDRKKVDFYTSTYQGHGINMQEVVYGYGTTPRKISDLLGIRTSEKAIILSLIPEDKVKEVLNACEDKYFLTKNGKGIAFTIPIKSMIGVMLYKYLLGIESE